MTKGNFYCLYDTLYEEYQKPFVMPNDKIARKEFEIFRNDLIEKAKSEKEKQEIKSRFRLMKYDDIEYNMADGFFLSKGNSYHCYELTSTEDEDNE